MLRLLPPLAAVCCLLTGGCGADADEPPQPSELTGVITRVEGDGEAIRGFTLEVGLETYEIRVDPVRDYGFPLTHLREHERDGAPVHCDLEERAGELYAVTIEDAQ